MYHVCESSCNSGQQSDVIPILIKYVLYHSGRPCLSLFLLYEGINMKKFIIPLFT